MSPMERLGLAFCRFENLCWDEAAGEKPKGFDEAKDSVKRALVREPMRKIKAMLGAPYINRCRWVLAVAAAMLAGYNMGKMAAQGA